MVLRSQSLFRLAILVVFSGLASCATYSSMTESMRSNYRGAQFKEALDSLEKLDVSKTGKRGILYRLDKAMINDRMDNHKEARALLIEADKNVDELYTKSLSKNAATLLVNDSTADYEPEDFEKVAIHTQLALSFLQTDERQSARVSARKINSRLSEINKAHDDAKDPRYSRDAFALYLSGLIYESRGEWDDAIIDYRDAYKTYRDKYSFFVPDVPEALIMSYYGVLQKRGRTKDIAELKKDHPKIIEKADALNPKDGTLLCVFEVGTIAAKESSENFLPIDGQLIRFSFPRIPYMSDFVGKTGIEVNNQFIKAEQAQNLNKIAYYNLEERRGRMVLKASARLIAKGVAVHAVRERYGPWAGLLANVLSAATETADTRSWSLLPASYHVARLQLPAGNYKTTVFKDGSAKEQNIVIRSGQFTFVRVK